MWDRRGHVGEGRFRVPPRDRLADVGVELDESAPCRRKGKRLSINGRQRGGATSTRGSECWWTILHCPCSLRATCVTRRSRTTVAPSVSRLSTRSRCTMYPKSAPAVSEDLEARVPTVAIFGSGPIKTRRDLSAPADDSAKRTEDGAVAATRPAALVRLGVPADESADGRADLIVEQRPGGHGRSVAHRAAGVNAASRLAAKAAHVARMLRLCGRSA